MPEPDEDDAAMQTESYGRRVAENVGGSRGTSSAAAAAVAASAAAAAAATAERDALLETVSASAEQLSTPSMIEARRALRAHPKVVAWIEVYWRTFPLKSTMGITKQQYLAQHALMFKALHATYDPKEAYEQGQNDWARDVWFSSSPHYLDAESFGDALFEVVDLWTLTVSAEEYVHFLADLYHKITDLRSWIEPHPSNRIVTKFMWRRLRHTQVATQVYQPFQYKAVASETWKDAVDVAHLMDDSAGSQMKSSKALLLAAQRAKLFNNGVSPAAFQASQMLQSPPKKPESDDEEEPAAPAPVTPAETAAEARRRKQAAAKKKAIAASNTSLAVARELDPTQILALLPEVELSPPDAEFLSPPEAVPGVPRSPMFSDPMMELGIAVLNTAEEDGDGEADGLGADWGDDGNEEEPEEELAWGAAPTEKKAPGKKKLSKGSNNLDDVEEPTDAEIEAFLASNPTGLAMPADGVAKGRDAHLKALLLGQARTVLKQRKRDAAIALASQIRQRIEAAQEKERIAAGGGEIVGASEGQAARHGAEPSKTQFDFSGLPLPAKPGGRNLNFGLALPPRRGSGLGLGLGSLNANGKVLSAEEIARRKADFEAGQAEEAERQRVAAAEEAEKEAERERAAAKQRQYEEDRLPPQELADRRYLRDELPPTRTIEEPLSPEQRPRWHGHSKRYSFLVPQTPSSLHHGGHGSASPIVTPHSAQLALARKRGSAMVSNTGFNKRAPAPQQPQLGTWSRLSAPQRPRAMSWPPLDMRASDLNEQPPSLERLMSGQAKADAAVKARAAAVAERAKLGAAESESSDEEESVAPGAISSPLLRPRPNSGGARRLSPAASRRGSIAVGSPLSPLRLASSRRSILLGAGIGLSSKPPPFASIAACHEHAPATGFTSRQRTPGLAMPVASKKPKQPAKSAAASSSSAIAEGDEDDLGDLVPAPPEQLESDDEDAEAELNDASLTDLERQKKAAQREVDDFVKQMDARRRARRPSRIASAAAVPPIAGSLSTLSAPGKYGDAPIEIDPSAQNLYDAPPPGLLLFDDSDDELDGAPLAAPFDLDEQLSYTPRGRHAAGCPSPNPGLRALDGLRRVDLQRAMGVEWVWGQVGVGRQRLIVSLPPNTWDKIWYLQGKIQEADAAASARRAAKLRKRAQLAAQGKGKGHNRKPSANAPLHLTAKQIETNAALKAVADRHAAMEAAAAKALAEKDAPVESSENSEDEAEAAAAFALLSSQDWEQAGAIWSAKYEKRWKASVCQSMASWAREHEAQVEKRAQALGRAAGESAEEFAARQARESAESSANDKLFWSAIADQEAHRRMEKALKAQQQAIVLAAMEPPAPVVDSVAEAAAAAEAKANKRKSKRSTKEGSKLTVVKKKHDRTSKIGAVNANAAGDIKEEDGEADSTATTAAAAGNDSNTLTVETGDGSAGTSPIGSPIGSPKSKASRKVPRSAALRKGRSSGVFGPDGAPLTTALETAAEGGDDPAAATAGAGDAATAADGKKKVKKKKKKVVVTTTDGAETGKPDAGSPDAGSPTVGSPTPGSPVPKRKTLRKKAAAAADAASAVAALEKLAADTGISPTAAAAAAAAGATDTIAPATVSPTASSRHGSAGIADPALAPSSLGDANANAAEGDMTAPAAVAADESSDSDSSDSASDSGASLHGRVLSSAEPSRAATPVPADADAEADGAVTGESQFPSEWPSEMDSEADAAHADPNDPALAGAGSSISGEKRLSRIQSANSEHPPRRSKPSSAASVGPSKSPSRSPHQSPQHGPQAMPLDGAVPDDGLKHKKKSRKREAREAAAAAAAAALIAPADSAAAVDAAAAAADGDGSRALSVAGSKRDSRVPSAASRAPRKAVLAGPIHGVIMSTDDHAFEGGDEDGAAILASGAVSARDEPAEIEDSGLNADGEPRFEAPEDSEHWTAEEKRAYREMEAQLDRQRKLLTMHAEGDMARTEFQWAMRKEEIKDDEVLAAEARRKLEAAQAKEAAMLAAEEKKRLAEQKAAEKLAAEVRAKAAAEIAKREAKEAAAQREIKRKAAVAQIMAAAEQKRRERAETRAARVAAAEAAGVELSEEEDTTAADAAELEAALAEHAPPPKAASANTAAGAPGGPKKKVLGIKPKPKAGAAGSTLKVAGDSAAATEGSDGDAAAVAVKRRVMRKSGGVPTVAAGAVGDKKLAVAVNPDAVSVTPDRSAPTSPAGSKPTHTKAPSLMPGSSTGLGPETIDPIIGLSSPQLSPDGSPLTSAAVTRPGSSNLMQPAGSQQTEEPQFEEDGVTPKPGSIQHSRGHSVDLVSGSISALTSARISARASIHGTPLGSALRSPTGSVGSAGSGGGGADGDGSEFALPGPAVDESVAALLSALAGGDSGLRNAASGILTPERRQSLLRASSASSQRPTAASKHATPGSTRPGTAQLFPVDGRPRDLGAAGGHDTGDAGLSGDEQLQSGGDESPVEEDEGAVLTDGGQHVIMPDGSRQPSRASTRASTRASSASAVGGSPKVRRSRPPTGNATPAMSEHDVSAHAPQSSRRTTALTHPPFAPEDPSLAVSVESKRILSRPSTGRALSPQIGPMAAPKDASRPVTAAEVAAAAAIALPGSPALSALNSTAVPSKRATLTGAKSPPVGSSKKLAPSKRASGRAGSSSKSPKKRGSKGGKKKDKFVLEAEQYVPSEDDDDEAPVNFDDDIDALTGWGATRGSKDSIGGSMAKPQMSPKTAAAVAAAALPPTEELDVWASTPAVEVPEEPSQPEPESPAVTTTVTVEEAHAAPTVADETLEDEVAQTTPGGTPIPSARSNLKANLSRPASGVTSVVISSRKSSANSVSRQSSALPQVSESNDAFESAAGGNDEPAQHDDMILTESGLLVPRDLIDPLSMQHSLENSQRAVRMPSVTPTSSAVAPMIRVLGFAAPPRDDAHAAPAYEPREWDGIDPLAEAKRLRRLNKSAGTFRSLSLQEQEALTTETTLQGASVRSELHPGGSAPPEGMVPKSLGGSLLPNPLRPVKPFNRDPEPLVREPDPPMWREAMLAQAEHKPVLKASTSGTTFRKDEEVYSMVQERLHLARKEDLARRRALALASSNAQAGAASKKSWALWELASGKGEEIAHRMGSFHARLVAVQTKKAAVAAEMAREEWLASEESRRKRAAAAQKTAEDLRDAHQAHAIEIVTRREERDRKFHKEAWQRREIAMATQHLLSPGDRVAAREAFLANQAENHAAKEAEKARRRAEKYEQFQIEWQRTQQERWSQEVARFYALQRKQAELAQKVARKRGLPVQHVGVQLIDPESGSPSSAIAAMLGSSKPASAHPSEGLGAGAVVLHIPGLNAHPVSLTLVQALQTTVQFPTDAEEQQLVDDATEQQPIAEATNHSSYERVLAASALGGSLETVQEDCDAFSMAGDSESGTSARDTNWHPPVETTAVRKDIASLFGVRPSYIGQAPAPVVVPGSNVFLNEESLVSLSNEGTVLDKTYILPRMLVQPVVSAAPPSSDPAAADEQAAVQESQKQILIELMEQAKRQVQEAKAAQKRQQQEAAAVMQAKAAEEAQQAAAPPSPQPRSPSKRRPAVPTPSPKLVAPGSLASMIPPTPDMEPLRDDVDEDSEAAASVLAVRPIQPSPMKPRKKYTTHAQMRRDQAQLAAQQEQAEEQARRARKANAAQVAAEVAAADARAEALASARSTTSSVASSAGPLSPVHVSRTSISVASASPSLTLQARRSLLSSDVSSLANILAAQNIPRDERTTQEVSTASKQAAEIELVRATDPKTLAAQRSSSKLAAAESVKSELASTKLEAKRIETERLAREAAGLGPAEDVTAATVVPASDVAAAKELARNASKSSLLSGAGLFQGSSMDEWLSYINHGRLERTQRLHQAYHSLQAQKSLVMTRKFQAFKEAQQAREKGLLRSLEHEAAVTQTQEMQDHSHEAAEEAAMMAAAARISPEPAQGFATPASASSKSRAQSSGQTGRAIVTPSVAALASPPSTGSVSRPLTSVAAPTPASTAATKPALHHVLDPRSAVGDKHKSLSLEGESLLAEKTPSVSKGLQQLFSPARVLPKGAHATLQAAAIAGLSSSPAQREQSKREEARARSPSKMGAAKDRDAAAVPPRSRSISPHRRSPSPPRPLPFPGALPSPDAPRAAGIPIAQGVTASGLLFPQVPSFQANVDHEEQRQTEAEATSTVLGLQGVSTEMHQQPAQPPSSSNVYFVQHGPPIRGLNPLSPLTRVDPSKIHRSPYTVAGAPKPTVLLPEPSHPHEAGPSEAHWTATNPFSSPPPPPPVPIVPPNLRSSGINPNPAAVVVRKSVQNNAGPEQSYEAIIAASVESPAIVLADAPVPLQERPPGRRTNHANPHLARSNSRSNSPSRATMQQASTPASAASTQSLHPKASVSVMSPPPKAAVAATSTVTSPPPHTLDRVPSGGRKQLQPLEGVPSQASPGRGTLSASASAPSLHGHHAKDAKSSPSSSPPSRSPRSTLQPLESGAGLYSPTSHNGGFYSPSALSHSASVGGLFASPAPRRATVGATAGPRSPLTSILAFGEEHKDTSSSGGGGGSNVAALQAANRALRIQADGSRGSQSIPQKSAATKTMFVIEPTISTASKQQQQQQQTAASSSSSPLKGAALRESMRQRAHEEDLRQTAALFAATVARTQDAATAAAARNPVSLRATPSSFGAPFVIPRLLPPPHRPSPVKLLMQHGASYAMGGHVESPQQPAAAAAKPKNIVALATLPRR